MHMRLRTALLAIVAVPAVAAAQPSTPALPNDGATPASTNVPGAQYPRVHPDGRVSFRYKAPKAQRVQLRGGEGLGNTPLDLTRSDDGTWEITTPPVVPGFHYYWFVVDSVATNDPSSETFFGYLKPTSGIEVPEPGVDFYGANDVPHGEVRMRWYRSRTTGQMRRAVIYTPPGYDADSRQRYPVLYLQHGAGEDERAWVNTGRLNFILDNCIAAGRCRPMLVVMERGYASKLGITPTPTAGLSGTDAFGELLVNEVVPMIDSVYRTQADREHRAIAGLSMGGMQALQVGLTNSELFAWVGSFSGPIIGKPDLSGMYNGAFRDAGAFNARTRLLWLGAGTAETSFYNGLRDFHAVLQAGGINALFVPSPGTGHEFQTWRRALNEFAPRLFR